MFQYNDYKSLIKQVKTVNMTHRTIPSNFLKNVLQNGVGRHVCQLQRITLSLCKSHPSSLSARDFVERYLIDFTRQNPGIVFYVKPRRHRQPLLTAEYLNGNKEEVNLASLSPEEIAQYVGLMKGRSGVQIVRLRKDWHTDTPSIQGVWSPFTFRNPKFSQSEELSSYEENTHVPARLTASERIKQMLLENQERQVLENKNRTKPVPELPTSKQTISDTGTEV